MTEEARLPHALSILLSLALLAGCAKDGDEDIDSKGGSADALEYLDSWEAAELDGSSAGERWAGSSAPMVVYQALMPLFMVELVDIEGTSTCPKVTEGPTGTTYEGNCTDESGNIWFGRAETTDSGLVFADFGLGSVGEDCPKEASMTWSGRVTDQLGDASTLSIQMVLSSKAYDPSTCLAVTTDLAWDYEATYEEDEDAGWQRWNGHGRVGVSRLGVVEVETIDEVMDEKLCGYEPVSGATYARSRGTELRFQYDGETDCDEEASITWYRDDEPQGVLTEVACAAVRPSGGLAAFCLGLLGLALRRR